MGLTATELDGFAFRFHLLMVQFSLKACMLLVTVRQVYRRTRNMNKRSQQVYLCYS